MTVTTTTLPTTAPPRPATSVGRGLAMLFAGGLSSQAGAAVGSHAFGAIGPAGVVAVRQLIAAAVLLPTVRPPVRSFTWSQWWPILLLGVAFGSMNLTLYSAVDRIGLGLAVTLEFLGPLAVALACSRRRLDLGCASTAAAGVYLLVLPDGSTDYVGIGLGLVAAASWAAYILLNRLAGQRLPGLQATATASGCSALIFLPVVIALLLSGHLTAPALLCATVAGVLSSVVPFTVDLTALRVVPPRLFAIFMSIHPALAVVVGLVMLGQVPVAHEVLGVAVIVATNVVAVGTGRRIRPVAQAV